MKAFAMHQFLILACILFPIETLNAMPKDYEAIYSVKLMQADGTLRAKLESKDGRYIFSLKTQPTGFWSSSPMGQSMSQANLRSSMKK